MQQNESNFLFYTNKSKSLSIYFIIKVPYACSKITCNDSFYSYKLFKDHSSTHEKTHFHENLGKNLISCHICNDDIECDKQLDSHLQQHKERFLNTKGIRSFETKCFTNNDFKCTYPDCHMKIKYLSDLKEHIKKHFKCKIYQCSKCKKKFSSKTTIKNHILSHIKNRPYSCFDETCFSTFINLSQLRFHYKVKHCNTNNHVLLEEEYDKVFDENYSKHKEDIENKYIEYMNEYKQFMIDYPLNNLNENKALLNNKRKESSFSEEKKKEETLETSESLLSNEEKMILILLEYIKEKMEVEDFHTLIMMLSKIK